MRKARVLLADDHKMVAEGLRSLLETEFDFMGTVSDGRALVARAKELCPDVIVTDISMPHLNGIEAIMQLKRAGVVAEIVILTMHHDVRYVMKALEIGASGFVLKHSASNELVTAIHEVLAGGMYVTPLIVKELLRAYRDDATQQKEAVEALVPQESWVL
jgi:DNA-binding NarL/FixJ family response regulator